MSRRNPSRSGTWKEAAVWCIISVVVIVGTLGLLRLASMPLAPDDRVVLTPCEVEDDDNCYWDADTMGNGAGRSFVVIEGRYFYEVSVNEDQGERP